MKFFDVIAHIAVHIKQYHYKFNSNCLSRKFYRKNNKYICLCIYLFVCVCWSHFNYINILETNCQWRKKIMMACKTISFSFNIHK